MTEVFIDRNFRGEGLACRRGGRRIFENLAFHLKSGGLLLVMGPNGSGKSTFLRAVAGLLSLERGVLTCDGQAISARDPDYHADLVYVGHKNAIKPSLTVRENLDFWARFSGVPGAGEAALDVLDLRPLADMRAGELSAGQQRRLALSRLFLRPVPLWLLDEPTVGLDRQNGERFAAAMTDHLAAGGMIMAATHADLGVSDPAIDQAVLDLGDFAPSIESEWEDLEVWA